MPKVPIHPYRLLILCLFSFFAASLGAAQTSAPSPLYLDPSLSIDQRVNDLVSRMTLEEKTSQMQDEAGARKVVPGNVEVWIGGGQPIASVCQAVPSGAKTLFTITSGATLPE